MVALTTLTLWSLGQAIVVEEDEGTASASVLIAPAVPRPAMAGPARIVG